MELSRSASKPMVRSHFEIGPALALHLQHSFGTRARDTDLHRRERTHKRHYL
jgi:hypothetical protein